MPNFPNSANVTGLTSALGDLVVGAGASGLTSLSVGQMTKFLLLILVNHLE